MKYIWNDTVECDVIDICNLKCKDCSHISPLFAKNLYSFTEFKEDILKLSSVLRCNEFTILGGEPLILGEKLLDYVEILKHSKICNTITIVTNGLLLQRYAEILKVFDTIRVSLYPHKHKAKIKSWIESNKHDYKKLEYLEPETFGEVFSTNKLDEERSQLSWDQCWVKTYCNTIYKGYYYRCFGAAKFHKVLDKMGIENIQHIGCNIHTNNLNERLQKYINDKTKITTCSYCLGHIEHVPWQEKIVEKVIK